jgi:hypothetical protein
VISDENMPPNAVSTDGDFTMSRYRELLSLATKNYDFADYDNIPWGQRFILWRHDCDCSLNRAHALALVEAELGIRTTYFFNPHSEFYNLFERSQYRLVRGIIEAGHRIGLHFDAAFHGVSDETTLSRTVGEEAALLEHLFGVRPVAFSFHNPLATHLQWEADCYSGLVNCYARRFKKDVGYCSDSNGYWRFRRLRDVLEQASDSCLQVLTHPGWWQGDPMPPRQRIFRSVYGRARATMASYDATLAETGRMNHSGAAGALTFLRDVLPDRYALLDYLWMSGEMATLFIELWRLHESQINKLCKAVLRKEWRVPASEVNVFFESPVLAIDGWRLFVGVFGSSWQAALGVSGDTYAEWVRLRNRLVHGRGTVPKQLLQEGCVFLCGVIAALATWGRAQPIGYDGLAHLGSIGLPTCKTADGSLTDRLEEVAEEIPRFSQKRWEQFKTEIAKVGADGTAV